MISVILSHVEGAPSRPLANSPRQVYNSDMAGFFQARRFRRAIRGRQYDTVRLMLMDGANPNADVGGVSHLIASIGQNDQLCVRHLLHHGADPNSILDYESRVTPLLHACRVADATIIRMLIDARADVNSQSTEGVSPLMNVAQREPPLDEQIMISQLLIERGADVNALTVHSLGAIHMAAARGQERLVRFLLESGAVLRRDLLNRDPIEISEANGYTEIAQMLREAVAREESPSWNS